MTIEIRCSALIVNKNYFEFVIQFPGLFGHPVPKLLFGHPVPKLLFDSRFFHNLYGKKVSSGTSEANYCAEFRNLVRKLILRRQAQSMCKKIHAKLELQLQMNLLIQLPSSIRSCMILLINNFSVLRGGAVHIPPLSKINFVTFLHYHQPLEN